MALGTRAWWSSTAGCNSGFFFSEAFFSYASLHVHGDRVFPPGFASGFRLVDIAPRTFDYVPSGDAWL